MVEVVEGVEVEVGIDLSKFDDGLNKAVTNVQKASRKMAASFKKVGKSVTDLGKKMTTRLTLPIVALGGVFLKTSADAEEMLAKFRTVFGASSRDVIEWADEFGNAAGRSTFALLEMASTVQDTFVPLGFARGAAAELSKSVTKLAVDVASFNNKADADVIRDFQSALVGNSETVRKYSIILTQAALDAELLRLGFEGGALAATEQQKVQARLNLLFAGTTDAQDDAIRTSQSLTNQTKRLIGNLNELSIQLGNSLKPIALAVVRALNSMVEQFKELTPRTQAMVIAGLALTAALGPLVLVVGQIALGFAALSLAIPILARGLGIVLVVAVRGLIAAFAGLVLTISAALTPIGALVAGITVLVGSIVVFRRTIVTAAQAIGKAIQAGIIDVLDGMIENARINFGRLEQVFVRGINVARKIAGQKPILVPLVVESRKRRIGFKDALSEGLRDTVEQAKKDVDAFITAMQTLRDRAGSIIEGIKTKVGELLPDIGLGAINDFIDDLAANMEGLDAVIKQLGDSIVAVGPAVEDVMTKTEEAGDAAASRIANAAAEMKNLDDFANVVKNTLIDLIKQLLIIEPLRAALAAPLGSFGALFGGGKAGGGSIQAGVPTLVGERGPEIIRSKVPASITNAATSRGRMERRPIQINQTLVFETTVTDDMFAAIQAVRPIIQEDTVNIVQNMMGERRF